jgi:tetratricopeptide (TPR) repeat protein
VQLRPDQSAYANYGAILHLNGKRDAALSMYQKALEMRHDDEITKENMNKLNRIKQNGKNSVFRYPGNGIFAENCPRKNCSEH